LAAKRGERLRTTTRPLVHDAFAAPEPDVEPPPRPDATRDVDRILRDLA
jgi:hypothetical protein